jgi:hypothetical protein
MALEAIKMVATDVARAGRLVKLLPEAGRVFSDSTSARKLAVSMVGLLRSS